MKRPDRLAAAVATIAVLAGAAWPGVGAAFSKVEVGQKIEPATLPTIEGRKHELFSRKASVNVILFFRPQHAHSERTLSAMTECAAEFAKKPVHWVGVVSGSFPKDDVKALVSSTGFRMPVLVDVGDELYGTLGVRLHPTVGITDGQGKLLAYYPFQKINYCDTIRARIQLALGEITPEQMEKVIHPERALMPSDVDGAVANRHVKLGRIFVRSKNFGRAEEQAREAVAKGPGDAPAHAFLGEVLEARGDCRAARPEYDEALRLDPANAAAPEWKKACAAP